MKTVEQRLKKLQKKLLQIRDEITDTRQVSLINKAEQALNDAIYYDPTIPIEDSDCDCLLDEATITVSDARTGEVQYKGKLDKVSCVNGDPCCDCNKVKEGLQATNPSWEFFPEADRQGTPRTFYDPGTFILHSPLPEGFEIDFDKSIEFEIPLTPIAEKGFTVITSIIGHAKVIQAQPCPGGGNVWQFLCQPDMGVWIEKAVTVYRLSHYDKPAADKK